MDLREERRPATGRPSDDPPRERREEADDSGERSLIRWMLSLSPSERLEVLQRHVTAVEGLRAGT